MTTIQKQISLGIALTLFVASLFWIFPVWNVWRAGLSGEAALMRATQTKQIMIETAVAEKDSAQLKADAIEIMGKAAQQYPEYRQQEFLSAFGEALREGNISQIMYIPTEANIPVMEAGRGVK